MEQNQQQEWQGTERRQSQGHYTGDERRKPQQEPDDEPQQKDRTDTH